MTPETPTQTVAEAVSTAGMDEETAKLRLAQEAAVRDFFKQFERDEKFDKPIREQIRKDRRYASGEAQAEWAVSTNLIGSNIDVTTATLYARDPDVSVRPAPQVDPPPDPSTGMPARQPERQRNQDLAKSLELVLSALWKRGKLKNRMRRVIRGVLSASHGWLKVLPACQSMPDPLAQSQYNTLQQNVAHVAAQLTALAQGQTLSGNTASLDDLTVQKQQLEVSLQALSTRLEVDTCYGFTFDVVKPENLQVGTDVELLEEYADSDSITEIMYFPHEMLREKFPELRDEDLKAATKYYRKAPKNANYGEATGGQGALIAQMFPNQGATEDLYTTSQEQEGGQPFARVLEKWNKADNHIYTAICGVKVWARKPYQPSWASSRFYPYFYFALNEVDGQRCPQSMASRGAKLQDEYASVRSNFRLTRQRSIPGTIVDASALADTELEKIEKGVIAEVVALRTTQPGQDFNKMFAGKPVPNIDMRLYDTSAIVVDLERTFGNQDANLAVTSGDVTATQAQIQQAGTSQRTSTSRDTIETVLSEIAQYCAEVALQKIPPHIAAKIAGPAVYWPHGLALEDITSLVEVTIAAGTTGKPLAQGDREAWGVILPQLRELAAQVFQLQQNPATVPLATALAEQMRETMRRFGDEGDLSRFIPMLPAAGVVLAPPVDGTLGPSQPGEQPSGTEPPPGPPALIPEAGAPGFFGTP